MQEPTLDNETIRSDLRKCPQWVVAMLRDERVLRMDTQAKVEEAESKLRALEEQMAALQQEVAQAKELASRYEQMQKQQNEELRKRNELVDMLERKLMLKENIIGKKDEMLHKVKDFVKEVQQLKDNLNTQMQERMSEKEKLVRLKVEQTRKLQTELVRVSDGLRKALHKMNRQAPTNSLTPALEKELKARGQAGGSAELGLSSADFSRVSRRSWRMNRDIKVYEELQASFDGDQVAMKIQAATLDDNHHTLDLKACQLTEIPTQIFTELAFIGRLDLSGNKLTAIPEDITKLRLLVILNLHNNLLTGFPGEAVKSLVQLRMLNISQNQLKSLPDELSCLPMLEVFDASNNQIESIPDGLGNIVSLEALDLSHNQIQEIPEWTSRLLSLEELYLAGNHIKELPESLTSCSNLIVLDIANNQLTELPEELHQLANTLSELKIEGNPLPPAVLTAATKGVLPLLSFLRAQANPEEAGVLISPKGKESQQESDVSSFILARGNTSTPEEDERVGRLTRRGTMMISNRRTLSSHKAIPPRLIGMSENFLIEQCDDSLKMVYGNDNMQTQEFNTFSDYRTHFLGQRK
jgi:myosin heavy subunit